MTTNSRYAVRSGSAGQDDEYYDDSHGHPQDDPRDVPDPQRDRTPRGSRREQRRANPPQGGYPQCLTTRAERLPEQRGYPLTRQAVPPDRASAQHQTGQVAYPDPGGGYRQGPEVAYPSVAGTRPGGYPDSAALDTPHRAGWLPTVYEPRTHGPYPVATGGARVRAASRPEWRILVLPDGRSAAVARQGYGGYGDTVRGRRSARRGWLCTSSPHERARKQRGRRLPGAGRRGTTGYQQGVQGYGQQDYAAGDYTSYAGKAFRRGALPSRRRRCRAAGVTRVGPPSGRDYGQSSGYGQQTGAATAVTVRAGARVSCAAVTLQLDDGSGRILPAG